MKRKTKVIPLTFRTREFFQGFYEEYKHFLLYIAGHYADERAEREDLVQEALLRLMKNAEILRELDRNQTAKYIELTVKTVYLDMERSKCDQKLMILDQAALEELLDKEQPWESGLNAYIAVEKLRAGLSRREWLALEGKYILGYSHEELSRILGVSPDSIRSMVFRARKKARAILHESEQKGES